MWQILTNLILPSDFRTLGMRHVRLQGSQVSCITRETHAFDASVTP